jgi:hypothetical protein
MPGHVELPRSGDDSVVVLNRRGDNGVNVDLDLDAPAENAPVDRVVVGQPPYGAER